MSDASVVLPVDEFDDGWVENDGWCNCEKQPTIIELEDAKCDCCGLPIL